VCTVGANLPKTLQIATNYIFIIGNHYIYFQRIKIRCYNMIRSYGTFKSSKSQRLDTFCKAGLQSSLTTLNMRESPVGSVHIIMLSNKLLPPISFPTAYLKLNTAYFPLMFTYHFQFGSESQHFVTKQFQTFFP
jgi:hypothetical protein